ncbi:hypothetical protein TYRP_023586, partial [Tyrophagus putrescentiae]
MDSKLFREGLGTLQQRSQTKVEKMSRRKGSSQRPKLMTGLQSCLWTTQGADIMSGGKLLARVLRIGHLYAIARLLENHTRVGADRTQALLAFKLYRQKVESQCSGHRVKQLMSDQARELTSGEFTEYLVDNQINHCLSTFHNHQQNKVAERAIQSIRNIARTNLINSNAPERFWAEVVRIAAHQYNVVPHSTDTKSTPFERMFGRKPDYDQLCPFGALTYFYKHP